MHQIVALPSQLVEHIGLEGAGKHLGRALPIISRCSRERLCRLVERCIRLAVATFRAVLFCQLREDAAGRFSANLECGHIFLEPFALGFVFFDRLLNLLQIQFRVSNGFGFRHVPLE